MQKLYKYIDISKDYWLQPLIEKSLYLSSIEQLRSTNDREEFDHRWETKSFIFSKHGYHLHAAYERLFSTARILCLSKSFDETCWKEFCVSGEGVCYEFSYNEASKARDITSGQIEYSDHKNYNAPDFIIRSAKDSDMRNLLAKESPHTLIETQTLLTWLDSPEPRYISSQHIVRELTFKKAVKFQKEAEYRFIHPEKPMETKTTRLVDSKLAFKDLGLELLHIHSTDLKAIEGYSRENGVTFGRPVFSI